jgi:CheY-like chemotaxis protein
MSTILIIDDDSSFLNQLKEILAGAGFNVLLAANGLDGMKLLEAQHSGIDLAIVDLSLPGMNGFEIIGAISRRPNKIKIIATTAVFKNLEAACSLGAHAAIRKPPPGARVPEEEWVGTVHQLLGVTVGGNRGAAVSSPRSNISKDSNAEKPDA